jgi:hypothetical protein
MQPHHRVVRVESELAGNFGHGPSVDDDSPENDRVLRLELLRLGKNAPAVYGFILELGELDLIDGDRPFGGPSQLVKEDVSYHAREPRFRAGWVFDLIATLERTGKGGLKNVLSVNPGATATMHEGQKLSAFGARRAANSGSAGCVTPVGFHDLILLPIAPSTSHPDLIGSSGVRFR